MAAAKKRNKYDYRKGQCVVCKYGLAESKNNGDLIVGEIDSVRISGKIYLTNLLAPKGKKSEKQAHTLCKRNQVVPKKEAVKIVKIFQESGYHAAREAAVKLAEKFSPVPRRRRKTDDVITQIPLPLGEITPLPTSGFAVDGPTVPDVEAVFTVFSTLTDAEKFSFMRRAHGALSEEMRKSLARHWYKEALSLFGVD